MSQPHSSRHDRTSVEQVYAWHPVNWEPVVVIGGDEVGNELAGGFLHHKDLQRINPDAVPQRDGAGGPVIEFLVETAFALDAVQAHRVLGVVVRLLFTKSSTSDADIGSASSSPLHPVNVAPKTTTKVSAARRIGGWRTGTP